MWLDVTVLCISVYLLYGLSH